MSRGVSEEEEDIHRLKLPCFGKPEPRNGGQQNVELWICCITHHMHVLNTFVFSAGRQSSLENNNHSLGLNRSGRNLLLDMYPYCVSWTS